MGDGQEGAAESRSLAERILEGQPVAEEEFVTRFQRRVFVMVLARTGERETAQEVTQEVLLTVLRAIRENRVRKTESLAAFVHGTTRNFISEHLRDRSRLQCPVDWVAEPLPAGPHEVLEQAERAALLRRGLRRLGSTDRQILLLSLIEGMKPGEIATRLGLSTDAVRQRKCRATKRVLEDVKRWSGQ